MMIRPSFISILCVAIVACGQKSRLSTSSPEAISFYEQGVKQLEQFYYSEAKASLDSALAHDSTFAMAWGRLATLQHEIRNEEDSKRNIATAVRLSSRASEREQLYIRFWDHMIRFDALGAGVADSLITLFPEEAEAYVMRGRLYEQGSKLDSAIQFYRKGAVLDSGYARAVMHLGYAYSTIGDQEKAISYMQKYIRMAPGLADPYASYADLLLRVGRYDEALAQYRRSLELNPDYWYAVNQIGAIYGLLGRLKDAEKQYTTGFDLLPRSDKTETMKLTMISELNLKRGRYEEAEEGYREVLGIDSMSYESAYGLVLALAKRQEFDQAREVSRTIEEELKKRNLTDSQVMVGFHVMRARVLKEQGKLSESRQECEAALERAVPFYRATVYRQLAEISTSLREYERAFLECEESLAINPNHPNTLLTLARLYHAKGDARMTREIGGRLLHLWKDADEDFEYLKELKSLLKESSVPSA